MHNGGLRLTGEIFFEAQGISDFEAQGISEPARIFFRAREREG